MHDILVSCYEDVTGIILQIPRVQYARLVADMSATHQTILIRQDGLKVASIRHARFPRDVSDIWYEYATRKLEFRLKQANVSSTVHYSQWLNTINSNNIDENMIKTTTNKCHVYQLKLNDNIDSQ